MAPSANANRGYWQRDEDAPHCRHCKKVFSWFFRRHHCRSCGYIFCNDCTKRTSPVPQRGLLSLERVCEACFALLRRVSTPQHSTASSPLVPVNGAAAVTCGVSPGTISSSVESKALGVAGGAAAAGALNTPNNDTHGAGAFGGSTSSSAMAPLVDIQRIASYTPMDDTSDGGDGQLAAIATTNTTTTPMTATGDRNPNATTAPSAPLPVPPALRTRTAWADDSDEDEDDDDSNGDAVGESARHAHTSSSAGASPSPPVATVHTGPVALDATSESDSRTGDENEDENDERDENEDGGDSETKRQQRGRRGRRREKGEAGGVDDQDRDDGLPLGPRSPLPLHGEEEEEGHRVRFFDTMIQRVERVDRHSQVAYNQETDTLEFQMEEVEDVSMLFPPLPRSAGNSVRLLMEPIKTRRPGANSILGLLSSGLATASHSSSNSNSNAAAADVDKLLTLVAKKVSVASPLKPVLTMINGVPAPENLVYEED